MKCQTFTMHRQMVTVVGREMQYLDRYLMKHAMISTDGNSIKWKDHKLPSHMGCYGDIFFFESIFVTQWDNNSYYFKNIFIQYTLIILFPHFQFL